MLPKPARYERFYCESLPEPMVEVSDTLIEVFRPIDEPSYAEHYEALRAFQLWLKQPLANPKGFSAGANSAREPEGLWVLECCSRWSDRYDILSTRISLQAEASKGVSTSGALLVLGLVGFDGEIDGPPEWLAAIGAALSRAGIPIPFNARKAIVDRNFEITKLIEEHYYDQPTRS